MPRKKKPAKPKKTRGPRGEGSTFPDKRRGGWRGKVPVGKYPDGRTRYREVWAPTQSECVALKKLVLPPGPETTVKDWSERWLRDSGARKATISDYRKTLRAHVLPAIGHRAVAQLQPRDLEAMLRGWKTLNPNSARKNFGQVRAMLEAARRDGLIGENPADRVKKPKPKRVEIDPFTPAELLRIIEACAADPARLGPIALMAAVGCRIGESLALDCGDYDPAAGTVSISRTYSPTHGLGPPKSENGIRTVRVPAPALPVLAAARGTRATGPLFRDRAGKRINDNTTRDRFARLLASLGLRDRNPHQLRHACATALVSAGVPLGDVAEYLGDSVEVVVRTYLHPAGTDPAAMMEGLFGAAQGGGKVADVPNEVNKTP